MAGPDQKGGEIRTGVVWLCCMERLTQDSIAGKLASCVALERQLEAQFAINQAIMIPASEADGKLPGVFDVRLGNYLNDMLRHTLTNIAQNSLV